MSTDAYYLAIINLLGLAIAYIIGKQGAKMPYKPLNIRKMIQGITEKPSSITSPAKRAQTQAKLDSLTQ